MRAKQGAETAAAGSSQALPALAPAIPPAAGTALEAQPYAPAPTTTRPNSRRRGKPKAAETSVQDDTTDTTSQATTVHQPQEQSAEPMPPKPRPRPRPRPTNKGKGKEKAANGDIPGEGACLEQPTISTVQPPIPSESSTQLLPPRESELQASEVTGLSNAVVIPAPSPGPVESQSDVQTALHESAGDADGPQVVQETRPQNSDITSQSMVQGQEERHDVTTTPSRGRRKRRHDDNIHVESKTAPRQRRSPRKKRKTLTSDGTAQAEAENEGNDTNDSPAVGGGEAAVDVSTRGRDRSIRRGRGYGRGRGRGRDSGLTEGRLTAAQEENLDLVSAESNHSSLYVPLLLPASTAVDEESDPTEAGSTTEVEAHLPNAFDKEDSSGQTHVRSRGKGRGRRRGRGRSGEGSNSTDNPPLRRSSRTGNASRTS